MSNAPSDATEGGDFPRGDLLVVAARFGIHKYVKKGVGQNPDGTDVMIPVLATNNQQAVAVAAFVDHRNDEGVVFNQFYSIGDPARFTVAADGSEIHTGTLKTNCNYYQLTKALVNAGYPEQKLREESKIAALLVGLYAKFDQEEVKRGDSSQLVLPLELYQFPWGEATPNAPKPPDVAVIDANGTSEQAVPAAATATAVATAEQEQIVTAVANDEAVAKVVESAMAMLSDPETEGHRKKDDLSLYIFKTRGADEKMEMMNLVMGGAVAEALVVAGVTITGDTLSI